MANNEVAKALQEVRETSVRIDAIKRNAVLNGVTISGILDLSTCQAKIIKAHTTIIINILENQLEIADRIVTLQALHQRQGETIQ